MPLEDGVFTISWVFACGSLVRPGAWALILRTAVPTRLGAWREHSQQHLPPWSWKITSYKGINGNQSLEPWLLSLFEQQVLSAPLHVSIVSYIESWLTAMDVAWAWGGGGSTPPEVVHLAWSMIQRMTAVARLMIIGLGHRIRIHAFDSTCMLDEVHSQSLDYETKGYRSEMDSHITFSSSVYQCTSDYGICLADHFIPWWDNLQ